MNVREESKVDREQLLAFGRQYHFEEQHATQVTRLALEIFDELQPLHGLGDEERWFLEGGGVLHDIGWIEGQPRHHKTALRMIMAAESLPFELRERRMIGLVARYHRKAEPKPGHRHYRELSPSDQEIVRVLGGILRVADGLDRGHAAAIRRVRAKVSSKHVVLRCESVGGGELEAWGAERKSGLLAQALGVSLAFEITHTPE